MNNFNNFDKIVNMSYKISEHFNIKKIIIFTLPSIGMMLISSIYGVVDGFFVSNYIGSNAFAAVNIVWPFEMILGSFGLMIGAGGSALVSKTMGEQKYDLANRYFSMLIIFVIIFGMFISILGIIFNPYIIHLLDLDQETINNCNIYANVLFIFLIFFMLQNIFQSFNIVASKPEMGIITMILSGITNILLDYIFIVILNMGIFGAALATGLSQFAGAIVPFIFFINKNSTLLRIKFVKIDFKIILKTSYNGISEMLSSISFSLVSILYNIILLSYIGINGVNAYGVILYISYIFISIYFGYSMGISPIISYNYGAKNKKELNNIFNISLVLICSVSILLTFIGYIFAKQLSSIFVNYDKELLNLTTHALHINVFSFLFCGYNIFASSLFTALNNGTVSLILSFLRSLIIQVVCILTIPILFGSEGIWFAGVVSDIISLIISIIFIFKYRNKYGYLNVSL